MTAGPAIAMAVPEPKKRPVPSAEPITIMVICPWDSERFRVRDPAVPAAAWLRVSSLWDTKVPSVSTP